MLTAFAPLLKKLYAVHFCYSPCLISKENNAEFLALKGVLSADNAACLDIISWSQACRMSNEWSLCRCTQLLVGHPNLDGVALKLVPTALLTPVLMWVCYEYSTYTVTYD